MPEEKPAKATTGGLSDESKLFGALCYIIGIIVPLFIILTEKKSDKFALFHAYQSLIITVALVIVWMVLGMGYFMLTFVTGGAAGILGCAFVPLWLGMVVIVLLLAYKAYMGERYKLPAVGDMAEKYAAK